MNPGKTHLIVSLQPQRLKVVAAQLNMDAICAWQGKASAQEHPHAAALEELGALLQKYEDTLQKLAARIVWEEEYVEEGV